MRVAGSPRSTLAFGASLKSVRWPSRVWMTSIFFLRAPARSALIGSMAAPSKETSLPSDSPKPPGSKKSRCMSITITAVRSGLMPIGSGSASTMVAMWTFLATARDSSEFGREGSERGFGRFFVAVKCARTSAFSR